MDSTIYLKLYVPRSEDKWMRIHNSNCSSKSLSLLNFFVIHDKEAMDHLPSGSDVNFSSGSAIFLKSAFSKF